MLQKGFEPYMLKTKYLLSVFLLSLTELTSARVDFNQEILYYKEVLSCQFFMEKYFS